VRGLLIMPRWQIVEKVGWSRCALPEGTVGSSQGRSQSGGKRIPRCSLIMVQPMERCRIPGSKCHFGVLILRICRHCLSFNIRCRVRSTLELAPERRQNQVDPDVLQGAHPIVHFRSSMLGSLGPGQRCGYSQDELSTPMLGYTLML
jgi:hypothetical protein